MPSLDNILKEINKNGFEGSLFCTPEGLLLTSQGDEDFNEKKLAAMSSLLIDSAFKAKEELGLSRMDHMRIRFMSDLIIMRNIFFSEDTQFVLAAICKAPDSADMDKYLDELLDWAVESSKPDLKKLSSL
jgi:predicted regulator of Ras-like GTPase activity (Roadblock/LC7/MglB family)